MKKINKKTTLISAVFAFILTVSLSGCGLTNALSDYASTPTKIETLSTTTPQDSSQEVYISKEEAIKELNNLTIAEPDGSSYDRSGDYGDWTYSKTDKHNTRYEVLYNQGTDVKTENNKIVGGNWYINYTGETVSYNSKEDISKNLQIDHIIPVSYANQHGAAAWPEDKKKEFYNDYGKETAYNQGTNGVNDYKKCGNLIVSDSHSNTSKSDKGPSNWLPSNKSYQVAYCEKWIYIASNYGISITKADYNTILNILSK